jgi:hypothetical protein
LCLHTDILFRPETVESLFIAWRLTGDIRYRNYSWEIFSSIDKYCRLNSGGYATVIDVDTVPVTLDDKQETFFLVCCLSLSSEHIKLTFSQSETLKYLYLTFSDSSVLPLNGMYLVQLLHNQFHSMPDLFSLAEYVFNTEVSTISSQFFLF